MKKYGMVSVYDIKMYLICEIKDIKMDIIGVVRDGKGIKIVFYGNEINVIKNVGKILLEMFRLKGDLKDVEVIILFKDSILKEF